MAQRIIDVSTEAAVYFQDRGTLAKTAMTLSDRQKLQNYSDPDAAAFVWRNYNVLVALPGSITLNRVRFSGKMVMMTDGASSSHLRVWYSNDSTDGIDGTWTPLRATNTVSDPLYKGRYDFTFPNENGNEGTPDYIRLEETSETFDMTAVEAPSAKWLRIVLARHDNSTNPVNDIDVPYNDDVLPAAQQFAEGTRIWTVNADGDSEDDMGSSQSQSFTGVGAANFPFGKISGLNIEGETVADVFQFLDDLGTPIDGNIDFGPVSQSGFTDKVIRIKNVSGSTKTNVTLTISTLQSAVTGRLKIMNGATPLDARNFGTLTNNQDTGNFTLRLTPQGDEPTNNYRFQTEISAD